MRYLLTLYCVSLVLAKSLPQLPRTRYDFYNDHIDSCQLLFQDRDDTISSENLYSKLVQFTKSPYNQGQGGRLSEDPPVLFRRAPPNKDKSPSKSKSDAPRATSPSSQRRLRPSSPSPSQSPQRSPGGASRDASNQSHTRNSPEISSATSHASQGRRTSPQENHQKPVQSVKDMIANLNKPVERKTNVPSPGSRELKKTFGSGKGSVLKTAQKFDTVVKPKESGISTAFKPPATQKTAKEREEAWLRKGKWVAGTKPFANEPHGMTGSHTRTKWDIPGKWDLKPSTKKTRKEKAALRAEYAKLAAEAAARGEHRPLKIIDQSATKPKLSSKTLDPSKYERPASAPPPPPPPRSQRQIASNLKAVKSEISKSKSNKETTTKTSNLTSSKFPPPPPYPAVTATKQAKTLPPQQVQSNANKKSRSSVSSNGSSARSTTDRTNLPVSQVDGQNHPLGGRYRAWWPKQGTPGSVPDRVKEGPLRRKTTSTDPLINPPSGNSSPGGSPPGSPRNPASTNASDRPGGSPRGWQRTNSGSLESSNNPPSKGPTIELQPTGKSASKYVPPPPPPKKNCMERFCDHIGTAVTYAQEHPKEALRLTASVVGNGLAAGGTMATAAGVPVAGIVAAGIGGVLNTGVDFTRSHSHIKNWKDEVNLHPDLQREPVEKVAASVKLAGEVTKDKLRKTPEVIAKAPTALSEALKEKVPKLSDALKEKVPKAASSVANAVKKPMRRIGSAPADMNKMNQKESGSSSGDGNGNDQQTRSTA